MESATQRNAAQGEVVNEKANQTTSSNLNATETPINGAHEKQEQDGQHKQEPSGQEEKSSGPEGGYSNVPIPSPQSGTVGYTLKFTFHRASYLLIGDMQTLSSDPYVLAQLNTDLPMRHKEDPKLRFRSYTERKTTDPNWNESWTVANVPSTGFELKLRVYDEDPADHDDLLGKMWINVPSINDSWTGMKEESYKLSLAQSSKRGLLVRSLAACFRAVPRHLQGQFVISIENLGRTGEDGQNGRTYTVGDCRWFRHHSPMLGRITHTKNPSDKEDKARAPSRDGQKDIQRYNFQANQIQLQGPVPAELYHRFVEFKPWVKRMFTTSGMQGMVLGKVLHHQHSRVYNFGRSTACGHFPQGPCEELTKKFLELVHYDQGGRIFTYVLTLDALWRFTETGKEFGIDMLSKHTMHSDVSIYIAFSGEFFVRRLKHKRRPEPPHPTESNSQQTAPAHEHNPTHPPDPIENGPPDEDPPTDPAHYELYIDNDSGTYRPNAALLPLLASFLSHSLPGLHVHTLDCQRDADEMGRLKKEQRDRKRVEGDQIIYTQGSRSPSISSSDESDLDDVQAQYQRGAGDGAGATGAGTGSATETAGSSAARHRVDTGDGEGLEHGTTKAFAKDLMLRQNAHLDKVKREYGKAREDSGGPIGTGVPK